MKDSAKGPLAKPVTCEVVTIGSELLLGQIQDTNATYLAQELSRIGIAVHLRVSVGDRIQDITGVLERAASRCDLVVTTGGLGPTKDDLTREAAARVVGAALEYRPELMRQVEAVFRKAGYRMAENNRRQAYIPEGGTAIPNPVGTAPGFIVEFSGRPIVCLPGVPKELRFLMNTKVIPWLQERFGLATGYYRVLKVTGIGESKVDAMIGDLIRPGGNPQVGLLASMGEIKIRITARAPDMGKALSMIAPVEDEILSRLGNRIFGRDEETLEGVVESLLSKRDLFLSVFETFTAGMAAARLHRLYPSHLRKSIVLPSKKEALLCLGLKGTQWHTETGGVEILSKVEEFAQEGIGLAILGFPKEEGGDYSVEGLVTVSGSGIQRLFQWRMGGPLANLQERGALIGLNTLRLALMEGPAEIG